MSRTDRPTDEITDHHAHRLAGKVIDDNAHRTLQTWVDRLDDEAADELLNRIYGAVSDEIRETLDKSDYEADMDDRVDSFGVGDSDE